MHRDRDPPRVHGEVRPRACSDADLRARGSRDLRGSWVGATWGDPVRRSAHRTWSHASRDGDENHVPQDASPALGGTTRVAAPAQQDVGHQLGADSREVADRDDARDLDRTSDRPRNGRGRVDLVVPLQHLDRACDHRAVVRHATRVHPNRAASAARADRVFHLAWRRSCGVPSAAAEGDRVRLEPVQSSQCRGACAHEAAGQSHARVDHRLHQGCARQGRRGLWQIVVAA